MNTIVLMGRLARDPETKLTSTQKGQTKVSRFPLVVKRNRTSKAFVVMITAYGNNAEFVEKYLEKGIKIALSGELVISQIKDEQTGTASYYTEVIMDNVEFAEAKTKKEESDGFQPAEKRKIPFDIPEELEQEGELIPTAFVWEDGRKYAIDKVSKPERCASRKAGGTGYRYTCQVGGKICHLTYEENYKWFMERK